MKKILSILLALSLLIGLCGAAGAESLSGTVTMWSFPSLRMMPRFSLPLWRLSISNTPM